MVKRSRFLDVIPDVQAATSRQLTQSDRPEWGTVMAAPESDASVPAGHLEVAIGGSDQPPVVVPADGGITAVGAKVMLVRDSSGRVVRASTPTRLPVGSQPVAVGVTGEWLAGLDAAQAGLDGRMDQADADIAQNARDIDQAKTEIADAKEVAEQAARVADSAQSAADSADAKASTADGRYTVAAANPTASDASGKPLGAVWEVRSGGTSLRRFVLTAATTWTQVKAGQDFVGDKAIGQAQIGDLAVGTGQIANLSVTDAKVGSMSVGKLTAGTANVDSAVVQKLSVAIANVIQLGVDRLVAGTGTLNEATAKTLWANIATFGNVTITEALLAQTINGIIINGGLFKAGGGSLPQVLIGPGSGVPGTGDTYGVYIFTPNNNANGYARLTVTPMGPSLAFYNSAGAETFFVDGAGNIRILNATDGGTVDLSAMATQRWQWDSSQQGSVQVTFNSTSGWSAWAFFEAANNNVTLPSIATVTSPTGRFRIDCGWELPSASTYDNTLMQLQFGFYTKNPNNFSRTDITNSLLGNLGRANAAGPGIVGVHSGQGSEVFTGNANTTYWVRPFYRQRVMSSNVTGIFNRMWASITPA